MGDERMQELEKRLNEAVAAVWERRRCQVIGRVDSLIRAVALLREGGSQEAVASILTDATVEAHRLAGSLGSFGFGEGSDIAAEIEELLSGPCDGQERPAWFDLLESRVTALKAYLETR